MATLDHYCERTDPSFWAEPLNAISNLGFIVVAWWLWRDAARQGSDILLLVGWAAATGIGSFLFHTFANTVTFWLDVVPILLFVLTYMWVSARRVLSWSVVPAAASVLVVLLLTLAAGRLGHLLNGAPFYIPTLLMLIGLTIAHQGNERSRTNMSWATAAFAVALLFRSLDHVVCATIPMGTHFLWHLLNAVAIFFGTKALIEGAATSNSAAVSSA
jgi:hypothetical protein